MSGDCGCPVEHRAEAFDRRAERDLLLQVLDLDGPLDERLDDHRMWKCFCSSGNMYVVVEIFSAPVIGAWSLVDAGVLRERRLQQLQVFRQPLVPRRPTALTGDRDELAECLSSEEGTRTAR